MTWVIIVGLALAYLLADEVYTRIHNWRILRRLRRELRDVERWQ